MAYRKKTWRRGKKSYRKKTRGKKAVKKMINRALASRGLLHPEIKHVFNDVHVPATIGTLTSNGPFIQFPLNFVQGPESGQMIGNEITAKYFRMKGHFLNDTNEDAFVRLMLVEDYQPTDDLYMYDASTPNAEQNMWRTPMICSELTPEKPRRFKALWDRLYRIPTCNQADGTSRLEFNKFVSLGNARINLRLAQSNDWLPINRIYSVFCVCNVSGVQIVYNTDFAYQDV